MPGWYHRNPHNPELESTMIGPIAYDVGMNNGDDSEYYLKKGYRVVAIEANPFLCEQATRRFDNEIKSGRITILNLGVGPRPDRMMFFIHKFNTVLSTFCPEQVLSGNKNDLNPEAWQQMEVEVKRLSDIINFFGTPTYVKIDIEGFDVVALNDLRECKIYPNYISAEAHQIDTFCHLVAMGYTEFKFVRGDTVQLVFRDHEIGVVGGGVSRHAFPPHSAGPFGDDIPGPWLSKNEILAVWQQNGGGWCDIHARMLLATTG
jgi:FkbM family methyltransferase